MIMARIEEKHEKIITFIIYPIRKDRMNCKAPAIAVNANSYASALIEAKERSRLSDFDNWEFI
jgi:hypothetical protein